VHVEAEETVEYCASCMLSLKCRVSVHGRYRS